MIKTVPITLQTAVIKLIVKGSVKRERVPTTKIVPTKQQNAMIKQVVKVFKIKDSFYATSDKIFLITRR